MISGLLLGISPPLDVDRNENYRAIPVKITQQHAYKLSALRELLHR